MTEEPKPAAQADNVPQPKRSPDLEAAFGRAWRMDLTETRARAAEAAAENGKTAPPDSAVCAWTVHAPNSHPFWPNVWIALIHLRPVQDLPDPIIHLIGATHEVVVGAFNPMFDVSAYIDHRIAGPGLMQPMNFAAQIIAESDEAAAFRIEETVREIVEGVLNPDTDGFSQWVARFGDNMVKLGFRKSAGRA